MMMHALDRPAPFEVTSREEDGVFVIGIAGELDIAVADDLEPHVDAAIDSGLPVLVDLQRADFVDSTGMRAIVVAKTRVERTGRRLGVCCDGTSIVGRALEIAALYDVLTVEGDREAALEALRAGD